MTNPAFTSSSCRNMAIFAFVIAAFCVSAVFSQNGGVSKDSKRVVKSKEYQAKERREREFSNRTLYTPAAIKKAQQRPTEKPEMRFHGESEPLAELASKQTPISIEDGMLQEDRMEPLFEVPEFTSRKRRISLPAFMQESSFAPSALTLGTNFEGPGIGLPGFRMTGAPPDTTMAVGRNHIVAWVNSQYAVFNKTGTLLSGPLNGNTLFMGTGTLCASTNRGDPILQYDRFADRWILSQFAFNVTNGSPSAPYLQCIAVSTTNDPTGTYYRYSITFGSTSPDGFNDYGKIGVWNDAYYTSYDIFGGSPAGGNTGVALCASDRTKMLAGDSTATTLCAPTTFYASGGSFLPADIDGTQLPTDTTRGGLFMRVSTRTGQLRYLRLKPNFATGTATLNDGFGGATGSFIALSPGPPALPCNGSIQFPPCIAQPGTTNKLDTLGDRLMYRLAYRNRGGVDNLIVTRSTDPDGAGAQNAAVSWYEIRNPLGNPADANPALRPVLFQNGIFNPGATGDRWMSSMATNRCGDIGMNYSIVNAGSLLKPSIGLTGRLSSDPVNTMQSETVTTTGTGSQTGTLERWGDYSTMQVDPTDDVTFWYINQYLAADGTFNWRTRITSAKFDTCAPVATRVEVGGRVLTQGGRGVRNAMVTMTDQGGQTRTVLTNYIGAYRFTDVETGRTYTISVISRRFSFSPRTLFIIDNISGVDFVARQ